MSYQLPAILAASYILWVCVPIIPAALIYALFPNQQIGIKGPLGTLTVSAGGAFAAYVIVFLLAFPIVKNLEDSISTLANPVWEVTAKVKLLNRDGSEASPQLLSGLAVDLRPDIITTAQEYVHVLLPEVNHSLPDVILRIPNFGSKTLDISDAEVVKDDFHRTIKITVPVEIKKFPELEAGIAKDIP